MLNLIYFIFLGTFGWGASLYLNKLLLVTLTPAQLVFMRMMIGSMTLAIMAMLMRARPKHLVTLMTTGVIFGVFNMGIPYWLTCVAETKIPSAMVSVVNGLTPLLTYIIAIMLFQSKTRLSNIKIILCLIGCLGIGLIEVGNGGSMLITVGLCLMLIVCVSYGIAANYVEYFGGGEHPVLVSMIASITTVVMMSFLGGATELSQGIFNLLSGKQWLALLWLGVVSTGISLYIYGKLIHESGSFWATMVVQLMTLTGFVLGVIMLDERISEFSMMGCLLTMLVMFQFLRLKVPN